MLQGTRVGDMRSHCHFLLSSRLHSLKDGSWVAVLCDCFCKRIRHDNPRSLHIIPFPISILICLKKILFSTGYLLSTEMYPNEETILGEVQVFNVELRLLFELKHMVDDASIR